MALDGSNENDFIHTDHGLTFVIEKELLEKIKPVRIDYVQSNMGDGFSITANTGNAGKCC